MVIGSSRNPANSVLFSKANISICVDEMEEAACRLTSENGECNVDGISSKLIALATDFRLDHDKVRVLTASGGKFRRSDQLISCREDQ